MTPATRTTILRLPLYKISILLRINTVTKNNNKRIGSNTIFRYNLAQLNGLSMSIQQLQNKSEIEGPLISSSLKQNHNYQALFQ